MTVSSVPPVALPIPGPESSRGRVPGGRRRSRATLSGLAVGALAYALLARDLVPAPVVLVVLVALVVMVPTAQDLSRRIALNGSLLIGWVPVLWWVRWPVEVDHGALVVAVAVATVTGGAAAAPAPLTRLRRLLPHARRVDRLLVLSGGAALASMWRWAFPGSPYHALLTLLPGVDNAEHFSMVATMRTYGATTSALGASPDGSRWRFDEYPQSFHALVATLGELTHRRSATGPDAVVAYSQGVSMVVVAGIVVLTAAVVSLPRLRDRPLVAVPVVVLSLAAFLWSPGQTMLADGFANFWLAAVAAGAALVLTLAPPRRLALPEVAAVGGLLVFVAHAWAPLFVVAAPAALALLVPLRETFGDRALRSRLWWAGGILTVAGLGVLKAFVGLFRDVGVSAVVTATGGIQGSNPAPAFALLVVALYVCSAAPALLRGRGTGDEGVLRAVGRARVLTLAVVAGLVTSALLFLAQLHTLGTSAYYFVKFCMGFELVLAALVPAVCGLLVASVTGPGRRSWRRWGAFGLATLATSQAFGLFPRAPVPLLDGHRAGTASLAAPYSAARVASGILRATGSSTSTTSFRRDYLAIGPDRVGLAFYADTWYHAILVSGSMRVDARLRMLHIRVVG
ncbi:MAG: hypothetical protein ABI776_14285, partial [Nocardioidaceae bacterium]